MNPLDLHQLPTPCLLLDVEKLDRNLNRMIQRVDAAGVALRPHIKTCKSIEVASRAFGKGKSTGPITVSTLHEAEYFASAGFRDILYAVSIVPQKLDRVAALSRSGVTVHVVLDDPSVAVAVAERAKAIDCKLSILIEIDCDGHRAGIDATNSEDVLRLATFIHQQTHLQFNGLMTHAGESYSCKCVDTIRQAAERERESIVHLSKRLATNGIACPIRSIGSSPTGLLGKRMDGVSELRAGVFMFQDLFQMNLGVCSMDDIALSVLATVISHRRDRGRLIVDAGAMALSKDRGTAGQANDCGFGLVCDIDGKLQSGYMVTVANQEHGIISNPIGNVDFGRFPIASRLRILPNHACMTAAAHHRYHAMFDTHIETWARTNGW